MRCTHSHPQENHTNESKYLPPVGISMSLDPLWPSVSADPLTVSQLSHMNKYCPQRPEKKSRSGAVGMSVISLRIQRNGIGSSSSYMMLHGMLIRTISNAVQYTRGVQQARVMSRLSSSTYSFQFMDQYLQVFFWFFVFVFFVLVVFF